MPVGQEQVAGAWGTGEPTLTITPCFDFASLFSLFFFFNFIFLTFFFSFNTN